LGVGEVILFKMVVLEISLVTSSKAF